MTTLETSRSTATPTTADEWLDRAREVRIILAEGAAARDRAGETPTTRSPC